MERTRIRSGTQWESRVAYSRAIRVDDTVYVSGTTATDDDGTVVGVGDAYRQTVWALSRIRSALEQAGARLEDVVRTRIFVTDISRWEEVGRAHREFFEEVCPAATMVEVQRLIHPDMLVEIEVEARVHSTG
jgi:enamine deaminase RidA (YjgF/YER057c/UK114 family)